MKKFIKFLSLLFIVVMLGGMITSCRGNSAKKAVDIVKKYSGKVFKNSEKNALILRHGDDVVRHINFQKVFVRIAVVMEKHGVEHATHAQVMDTCIKFKVNNSL